jgi:hypothetical protein
VLLDPGEVGDLRQRGAVEPADGFGIEIFDAGRQRQLGPAQALMQPLAGAIGDLVLQQQAQAIVERKSQGVGCSELMFKRSGHAAQAQGLKLVDEGLLEH